VIDERALLDAVKQPMWSASPGGAIEFVNRRWRAMAGNLTEADPESAWRAAVHVDDLARARDRMLAGFAGTDVFAFEHRFRLASGEHRWHLVHVAPVLNAANAVAGWLGTAVDIEERRRQEEGAYSSERSARHQTDIGGDIIFTLDLDGLITMVSPNVERITGFAPEAVLNRSIDGFLTLAQGAFARAMIARKLDGVSGLPYDLEIEAAGGRIMTLEISSQLVFHDGAPHAIHGMARDVSHLRAAQAWERDRDRLGLLSTAIGSALTAPIPMSAQLQRCVAALVQHFDAAFARIWTIDDQDPNVLALRASAGLYTHLDGVHSRIPVGAMKIGRIAHERRPFLTNAVVGDPEIPEQGWAAREGMVAFAGYPLTIGERLLGVLALFSRQPIAPSALAVLESTANVIAVGVDRSMHERAREDQLDREQAAREHAEAAVATLATVNRIGAALAAELNLEQTVQAVTDAATELTRARYGAFFYNVADERGESYTLFALSGAPRETFAGFPMPANTAIFGPTFRGEGVVRIADVTKDARYGQHAPFHGLPPGHVPVVSYLAAPVIGRLGEVLGGLFFGHTEKNVFNERDEELVTGLATYAAIAIDNGRLFQTAWASERRYRGLFEGVGDAILITGADHRYLDANPAACQLLGFSRDEIVGLHVEDLTVASLEWMSIEYDRFRTEGRWHGEVEKRRKDGSTVAVDIQATVVTLPEGAVGIAALRDISARRALQQEQQQFLEAVSHDLKNPLTVVRAQAQLLKRKVARGAVASEEVARSFSVIDESARRIERQLDELQDVARIRSEQTLEMQLEPVDFVELVTEAVRDARAGSDIHGIVVETPEPHIHGTWDALRLRRVLDNLLNNAVKYSPRGGAVRLTVLREERDDSPWVVLTVKDEGVGIPPSDLHRVFERYWRGSNVASDTKGTGIGQAGVHQIITQHGGTADVQSVEGQGSVFTIALPLEPPARTG